MPDFLYKATDRDGKWVSGEIRGATLEEAGASLLGRGLVVESLSEAEASARPQPPAGSREDLAELIDHLAALSRSGLPLPSGLRAAGGEMTSSRRRATFFELADLVESGVPLEDALASRVRRFPPDLRGLILAGSRSGRLAELLGEYVRGVNLGSELRRVFVWSLAYPTIALALVMLQVVFICHLSIRTVESLMEKFNDVGSPRPGQVEALMALTRFINDQGPTLLILALMVPALGWLTLRSGFGPAARRRVYCSIPVVGPILRFAALTEFCHILAMLIEAETPLPLAFELAGSSVRDAEVAEACARMARAVEAGEPLPRAVALWQAIPAGLGQLLRWSEGGRNLPEALHLAGDMFESRARSQASFSAGVLNTCLLLLILWWIGFAVAALYIPLLSMINRLSG